MEYIQEAKYLESWPSTTSAWAGWSRFDIPVDRYDGVHSLLILIEQNIKKRTGPALCVLCEVYSERVNGVQFSLSTIQILQSRVPGITMYNDRD